MPYHERPAKIWSTRNSAQNREHVKQWLISQDLFNYKIEEQLDLHKSYAYLKSEEGPVRLMLVES